MATMLHIFLENGNYSETKPNVDLEPKPSCLFLWFFALFLLRIVSVEELHAHSVKTI